MWVTSVSEVFYLGGVPLSQVAFMTALTHCVLVSQWKSQKAIMFFLFPSYWEVPRHVSPAHILSLTWFYQHLEELQNHPYPMTNA